MLTFCLHECHISRGSLCGRVLCFMSDLLAAPFSLNYSTGSLRELRLRSEGAFYSLNYVNLWKGELRYYCRVYLTPRGDCCCCVNKTELKEAHAHWRDSSVEQTKHDVVKTRSCVFKEKSPTWHFCWQKLCAHLTAALIHAGDQEYAARVWKSPCSPVGTANHKGPEDRPGLAAAGPKSWETPPNQSSFSCCSRPCGRAAAGAAGYLFAQLVIQPAQRKLWLMLCNTLCPSAPLLTALLSLHIRDRLPISRCFGSTPPTLRGLSRSKKEARHHNTNTLWASVKTTLLVVYSDISLLSVSNNCAYEQWN